MPVPGHRPDCSSKLWRTRCPNCRRTVFFFSCSCGSKVFFEHLGDPWPLHTNCVATPQVEKRVRDHGLPLPLVTPEGNERQVAGRIVDVEPVNVRSAAYFEVTLEHSDESLAKAAFQISFLVSRKRYLSLHCRLGVSLWALLK